MLKKTIEYTDFDDKKAVDTFYFHFTQLELAKMKFTSEDLADRVRRLIAANEALQVFELFEKIVLDSVGERSEDGKRFIKNEEIRNKFAQSNACSEFILGLLSDEKAASDFIKQVVPQSVADKLNEKKEITSNIFEKELTQKEIATMTPSDFDAWVKKQNGQFTL